MDYFSFGNFKTNQNCNSDLETQNAFLNFGISLVKQYNCSKLQNSIVILDQIKESLLENPENKVLKLKFQLKMNQLKSLLSSKTKIDALQQEIKKINGR